jgi:NifU-like protein involved in Fe-S cluster formation
MAQFNEIVLDHFKNPRNAGNLDGAACVIETKNPVCGDVLRLSANVEDGKITAARFKVQGCTAAIACGSVLTEMLIGKPLNQLGQITAQRISDSLGGLPSATFHAAQLAADAVASLARSIRATGGAS